MLGHEKRLREEHEQLNIKIRKLRAFTISEDYLVLPTYDQSLLSIQLSAMETYSKILLTRINK